MSVHRIAIVGAGTMGSGIAINAAQHGLHVTLIDAVEGAADRAKLRAASVLARFVERGRIEEGQRAAALARISAADGLAGAAGADLVIEAVFEDFDVKAKLFEALSGVVAPQALIATNTSALRVSRLAAHVLGPGRFLGLHYFSPAEINPVCELVRGEATSQASVDRAGAFLKATHRVALPCRDQPGFAVNRFFCPYTNEAARLLGENAGTTAQIDRAAEIAFGAAAGPFKVMNIIKPRINLHAIRNLAELGPFYAPAPAMVAIGETDGFFEVADEPAPDPAGEPAMVARIRAAVFLPVLQLLDEGVADAKSVDTGARLALKFAEPPCALMDRLERDEVARLVAPLAARFGLAMPASLARVGALAT